MSSQQFSIRELIQKLGAGAIQLPELQRKYVWTRTQIRDFIDSLYRRYPTGTLLMWETSEKVETRDVAVARDDAGTRPREYFLLDGQQRLTSLLALISGKLLVAKNKGRATRVEISFNLEHPDDMGAAQERVDSESNGSLGELEESTKDALMQRFTDLTFASNAQKLPDGEWVSVAKIFKAQSATSLLRSMKIGSNDPRFDKYHDRLQRLRDIQDIVYHTQTISSDTSYEEAAEIFTRVNTGGSKLRSSDLALARITTMWRGAGKTFEEYALAQSKETLLSFDSELYVRSLIAFATKRGNYDALHGVSEGRLRAAWEDSKKGIEYAANFLANKVGIDHPSLLSSPILLVTIAFYAHKSGYKFSKKELESLQYWSLIANLKGRYSRGSSNTVLNQDLGSINRKAGISTLINSVKRQAGRLEIREDDLDVSTKGSLFATMFLAFQKAGACDWENGLPIGHRGGGKRFAFEAHHIFPKRVLEKKNFAKDEINSICNLAFVSSETNKKIRDREPSKYLPEFVKVAGGRGFLEQQCIPSREDLWKVENYKEFLKERRRMVSERLNEFLQAVRKGQ